MQRIERSATQMYFDRDIKPVATVAPGERFVVETADSLCGVVKSEADRFDSFEELIDRLGGACPVTGPIHVEGASAGRCIAVNVEDIAPAPLSGSGWTAVIPGLGALTHDQGYTLQPPVEPRTSICTVNRDRIILPVDGRSIEIPTRPFLGTIGVAPGKERRISFSQSHEYLGDVDIPQLGAGSRLILNCNVDGGLLSLGDAHAAQGDGEITGAAIEIESDVTLSVDVLEREEAEFVRLPILEAPEWIGCIASFQGVHTGDCIRAGFVDLVTRMTRFHGFTEMGAYQLLGQVGRVQIGNLIDPFYSVMTYVERRYLS